MVSLAAPEARRFLDRTPLGPRFAPRSRLAGAERIEAYAALDRDLAAQAAPFAEALGGLRTDFFSARIGCQVEHPLYGIDSGRCACAIRRLGH